MTPSNPAPPSSRGHGPVRKSVIAVDLATLRSGDTTVECTAIDRSKVSLHAAGDGWVMNVHDGTPLIKDHQVLGIWTKGAGDAWIPHRLAVGRIIRILYSDPENPALEYFWQSTAAQLFTAPTGQVH